MRGAFNLGMLFRFTWRPFRGYQSLPVFADSCLASYLQRMTFVASGFLRIGDGIERISCQQRELPRT